MNSSQNQEAVNNRGVHREGLMHEQAPGTDTPRKPVARSIWGYLLTLGSSGFYSSSIVVLSAKKKNGGFVIGSSHKITLHNEGFREESLTATAMMLKSESN